MACQLKAHECKKTIQFVLVGWREKICIAHLQRLIALLHSSNPQGTRAWGKLVDIWGMDASVAPTTTSVTCPIRFLTPWNSPMGLMAIHQANSSQLAHQLLHCGWFSPWTHLPPPLTMMGKWSLPHRSSKTSHHKLGTSPGLQMVRSMVPTYHWCSIDTQDLGGGWSR